MRKRAFLAGKDNASFIKDILYDNITFRDSLNSSGFPCAEISADYRGDGHGYVGSFLPHISNVKYKNVDLSGCSTPMTMRCNGRFPCRNISFEGVVTGVDFVCANVSCSASGVAGGHAACCKG